MSDTYKMSQGFSSITLNNRSPDNQKPCYKKSLLTTKACSKDSWWSKPLDASCSSIAVSRTRSRQTFHLPLVDEMASTLTASARPSLVSIYRLDLFRTSALRRHDMEMLSPLLVIHGEIQRLPVEPVKRGIDICCVISNRSSWTKR